MKILYYCEQLFKMGGIERVTVSKANWFVENGHEVSIVCKNQGKHPPYYPIDSRVKLYNLNLPDYYQSTNIFSHLIYKWKSYKLLKEKLKDIIYHEKPDIGISVVSDYYPILPDLMKRKRTFVEFHASRQYADKNIPLKEKIIDYNLFTRFIAKNILRLQRGWTRSSWHYYMILPKNWTAS